MLILKKIKRNDEYIEAYYTPEDSNEEGYIKIRLSDEEVIEKKLTSYDRALAAYFGMARNKLWDILKDADIPTEIKVMWY